MVKHGYVPLGRSVTVPKKHDSFFAMLKSFVKEKMKNKPEYHWCELIKLPCSPKDAELAVKLDVDGRKLRVTGKNPAENKTYPSRGPNLQCEFAILQLCAKRIRFASLRTERSYFAFASLRRKYLVFAFAKISCKNLILKNNKFVVFLAIFEKFSLLFRFAEKTALE